MKRKEISCIILGVIYSFQLVLAQPNFRALKYVDPVTLEPEMSSNNIEYSDLKLGSRIVFKTGSGTYGKMEILDKKLSNITFRIIIRDQEPYINVYGSISGFSSTEGVYTSIGSGTRDIDHDSVLDFELTKGIEENVINEIFSDSLESINISESVIEDLLIGDNAQHEIYRNRRNARENWYETFFNEESLFKPINGAKFYELPMESDINLDGIYINPVIDDNKSSDQYVINHWQSSLLGLKINGVKSNVWRSNYDPVSERKNMLHSVLHASRVGSEFDMNIYSTPKLEIQERYSAESKTENIEVFNGGTIIKINGKSYVLKDSDEYESGAIKNNRICGGFSGFEGIYPYRMDSSSSMEKLYVGEHQDNQIVFLYENSEIGDIVVGMSGKNESSNGLVYSNIKPNSTFGLTRILKEETDISFNIAMPEFLGDNVIISRKKELFGIVDMHTHPMSHLAFGGNLFHGGVEDAEHNLQACDCNHGWNIFGCGNIIRSFVASEAEGKYGVNGHDTKSGAFPSFTSWPAYNMVLHQQMYVDWIERAHREGGLNIMVALAVNSHTLADIAQTDGYNDDLRSMNLQIEGMKQLDSLHEFMEIALTSEDLRRIVLEGKLAIILGVEMDNIGNFYNPADRSGGIYNTNPTLGDIELEIDRLFDLGIRYFFPIHITNNVFGGAAIYDKAFNMANKYNTGETFDVESISSFSSGIGFDLERPEPIPMMGAIRDFGLFPGSVLPFEDNYPDYTIEHNIDSLGHRNVLGLTEDGVDAIHYAMSKGMMIDIDHMSEQAADSTLGIATLYDYPINSGHNELRKGSNANENSRRLDQIEKIKELGGMIGLGHGRSAENFSRNYKEMAEIMDYKQVAIGTDVNGLFPLPGPPQHYVRSSKAWEYTFEEKTWDYTIDGMAHYGMFPEFMESLNLTQGPFGVNYFSRCTFQRSAEYFAQMWEKCESRAAFVRP